MKRHEDAVARRAWHFAGNHPLFAEQAIDERGFSDVGTTDDGDADCVRFGVFRRRRFDAGQHMLHEIFAALAVARGDGQGVAQRQRMEIDGYGFGVEALGFGSRSIVEFIERISPYGMHMPV